MKKLKLAFAVLLCLLVVVQPVAADWSGDEPSVPGGVDPIYVDRFDNQNNECLDFSYAYGFKVDANAPNGEFKLKTGSQNSYETELLGSATEDLSKWVKIFNSDGKTFDWSSNFDIDAVIVKAGDGGNVYVYDNARGDGKLHAPHGGTSGDSGKRKDVSHVTFCWGVSTAVTGPGSSFNAEASAGRVTLAWETGAELDNAGFNLYRALLKDGPYTQINEALIAAEGDAMGGASYSFLDRPYYGTFYYKLEDVDLYGVSTLHGPVRVTVARRPLRRPLYRPRLPEF